jgi:hypothetical protein
MTMVKFKYLFKDDHLETIVKVPNKMNTKFITIDKYISPYIIFGDGLYHETT